MSTSGGFGWKAFKVFAGLSVAVGVLTAFGGLDRAASITQNAVGMVFQGSGVLIGSADDAAAGLDEGLKATNGVNGVQKSSNFPGISGFDKVPPKHSPHKATPSKP